MDLYNPDSGKISFQELKAYSDVHGDLSGFEISAIRRLSLINKG